MIVTWNSSNKTVGTIDAKGNFTALALGRTNITASNGTVNLTASVIVRETPVLTNIMVIPVTANVSVGKTQSFVATTLDQFNNAVSAIVTWASSNPSVGTIDKHGNFTALAVGTTTVTATNGSISGSALVNVTAPSVTSDDNGRKGHKEHKDNKELKDNKEDKGELEEDDGD